jgi:HSP20 family protein
MNMALAPFRGFWDVQSEVNRLFDQMLGGLMRRADGQARVTEWAPAIDVLTKDGDLVVRAELPGVRQEDVDITLQDNVLTISGERKVEQEEQRGGYYVRERRSTVPSAAAWPCRKGRTRARSTRASRTASWRSP